MKVNIAAPVSVPQTTIDSLVAGVQRIFPVPLVFVQKPRFQVRKKVLALATRDIMKGNSEDVILRREDYVDGLQNDAVTDREIIYFNLFKPATCLCSKAPEGLSLIFFDRPFMYPRSSPPLYHLRWTGKDRRDRMFYAGLYIDSQNLAIVGGDAHPSENNLKLTAHEIAHSILRSEDGGLCSSGKNHCVGTVRNHRCIMNPDGSYKPDVDRVYAGFCKPCAEKLKARHVI